MPKFNMEYVQVGRVTMTLAWDTSQVMSVSLAGRPHPVGFYVSGIVVTGLATRSKFGYLDP